MADRAPVEKLSLAVRKNVRDNFESKKAEHEKTLANLIGAESFVFDINPNLLYVYASDNSYGQTNLGHCINSYVEAFIRFVSDYTKSGKDEEAKEAIRKVASKFSLTILPTDSKSVSYCGMEFKDGVIDLLFNINYLGTNITDVGRNLAAEVDKALDALGGNDLPVVARRSIAEHLDPLIPKLKEKMKAMFGKDYTFAYDIAATIAAVKTEEDWMRSYGERVNTIVPQWTASYFSAAVETLERLKFGKDDMLQEAFVDATEKLTVRFQIVDKLQNGKTYNDSRFDNGELVIETISKNFGTNLRDCTNDIVNRL